MHCLATLGGVLGVCNCIFNWGGVVRNVGGCREGVGGVWINHWLGEGGLWVEIPMNLLSVVLIDVIKACISKFS